MKHSIVLGAIVLAAVVTLGGCGVGKTIDQKTGEKIMEKAIEAQTGAKVNIDSNGDDVVIKTEEGQTQYSAGGGAKLPDNFPKELIVADDAKVILASSSGSSNSIGYLTNYDQAKVLEKYVSDLPGYGWKKEMEIDAGEGKMLSFSRGKERATISIGNNNSKDTSGKTMVNVTLTEEGSE